MEDDNAMFFRKMSANFAKFENFVMCVRAKNDFFLNIIIYHVREDSLN